MRVEGKQSFLFLVTLISLQVYHAHSFCTSQIYCQGPILSTVAHLLNDTGDYVSMPMRFEEDVILQNYAKLPANVSLEELQQFLNANFFPAGSDVVSIVAPDWTPNPPFTKFINDSSLLKFGLSINNIWNFLIRTWNTSLTCQGCYSHIDVPYPFSIAGSHFTEYYYWDSYWVVEGLIASGMFNTTKGIILNFAYLVQKFGFVPNGGRVYYLNRSQPPLLTQMVHRYFDATNDTKLLQEVLPVLDLEYQFWLINRSVDFPGFDTNEYMLNRYSVNNSLPRPEGYVDDVDLAAGMSAPEQAALFAQIASTCESGWDFSSRWMADRTNLVTLQTNQIVPVDLNSILFRNEHSLAHFHSLFDEGNSTKYYLLNAQKRYAGIQKFLFNPAASQWNDYNLATTANDNSFYMSNFVPLWAEAYDDKNTSLISSVIEQLENTLVYPAGAPSSLFASGEQWDFPNGWAPLQYFLISGLRKIADKPKLDPQLKARAASLAFNFAEIWVNTNYCGWNKYGLMFEKYNVSEVGSPGGGGQYDVQYGFGWTNGVILHLLSLYGSQLQIRGCP